MKDEVKFFLKFKNKTEVLYYFNDLRITGLAYSADIFNSTAPSATCTSQAFFAYIPSARSTSR